MIQGTKGTEPTNDKGRPSEELFKILFEQAADGIFITDETGRFIEVNPRGCEMLGYTQAEIRKKSIPDFFPDRNMQAVFTNQSAIEAGHTKIHEGQFRRKDGSLLPVEINGQKLEDGRLMGVVRDMSERKKAQEEIHQLARFPSENPYPILRVSNQGKILFANDASAELLEEWNTGVGRMLPSAWKKTTSRLADKKLGQNVEVPCKGRVYSMTITPVPGMDYVNLYGSDITEIKRTEEALRRAEEKYYNIFEHSQDGIFQSTPTGRFITVNPALARIWGYESPEEVIEGITNIAHQIYVKSEQREEFLRLMDDNNEVQDFEFQAYRKDGSVIWVQENVRTVRDAQGNVKFYEGTVKDITEQKQMFAALRRSEERYRSTLNNMMEGCQIIDYDWRYIYVNDTAAMHGRRKPEEMLMSTMMEMYPGIENTEMFAVLRRCMENRTPERIENEFNFPNGEKGWFELGIQPVPEGLFILSLDISERKQAEIDLRDREARYRTLFDNLPIPVFTKDREGRYTSFNAEESKYWAESPIGHTDHELLPTEFADALRTNDVQVMETGEPWLGEEFFQTPTGSYHSLVRKVPLQDGNGNVIGVLGASLDITERKQAEALQDAVYQIAQITQVTESVEELIPQIHKVISDIMAAENFYIALHDKKNNLLSFPYSIDEIDPPISGAIPLKKGLTEYVLRTGKSLLCTRDIQDDLEKKGEVEQVGAPSPIWLGVPLKVDGKAIGVMAVQHYSDPLAYGEREQRILEFVSSQAAIALYRKQAEETLRNSEERFRSLYENAAIGIYRTTPEGQILMVNPAAIRMLGYENFDEMSQRNLEQDGFEATYPRSEFRERMEKENVITGLEKAWVRKDGSTIYVRESARAIRDENGIIKYYDGTFEDITEQKWGEEALRASEARFSTVFHASPVSIGITRLKDNVVVDVNDAWLELTGYSGDEAVGRPAMELNIWDAPAERDKMIEALQKHGRVRNFEFQVRKKSGEVAEVLLAAELIELSGEEHMLSLALDITDRKQAEQKLLESEERYRDLIDSSQELICTHDLEGNILSVNPWGAKTLGYKAEVILKQNIADFLLPETLPEFQEYLKEIQNNGRAQGQLTVQTQTGDLLVWEYNNSLRTEGVDQPIVRGMAHDVTEQRKAQKKIRQQLAFTAALNEIDHYITSSFDLNKTLDLLIEHVSTQLGIDAVDIFLVNSDANLLEYAVGRGFSGKAIQNARLSIGDEYAGRIVLERKAIKLPDLAKAEPPPNLAEFTKDEEFVSYFGLPLIAKGQIKGVLEVFHRSQLDAEEEWFSYLAAFAEQAAIAIDNAQLFNNLQETNTELTLAYDATIEGWSYALDLRDKETEGHTQRVTEITYSLCEKFGMSESELTYVRWGSLLHDIGKMGIPDSILLKPGKLSDEEWVIMKMHPVFARKMLQRVSYLKSAIDIPYYHHEKWDGSGYPEGLEGEQIPLTARIFAVADVWDALTSDRPYRPAWSKKDALNYIESGAGTHLDPQVVEVFLESKELWKVSEKP